MKRLAITIALIVFVLSVPVHSESRSQNQTIEELVSAVAEAYGAKDLGRLDTEKPYIGKVKIVIQHSLSDGPGEFEVKWVKTMAQAERWLKSKEIDELPSRSLQPLVKCEKGVCTYNFDGGILHNNLYLKKITYGIRKGRPYIKSILLLNGD